MGHRTATFLCGFMEVLLHFPESTEKKLPVITPGYLRLLTTDAVPLHNTFFRHDLSEVLSSATTFSTNRGGLTPWKKCCGEGLGYQHCCPIPVCPLSSIKGLRTLFIFPSLASCLRLQTSGLRTTPVVRSASLRHVFTQLSSTISQIFSRYAWLFLHRDAPLCKHVKQSPLVDPDVPPAIICPAAVYKPKGCRDCCAGNLPTPIIFADPGNFDHTAEDAGMFQKYRWKNLNLATLKTQKMAGQ